MDKIDKTKDNIQIQNLEEKERKEIFDKLVKGGGKVVDDRQKRRSLAIDREKQRQFKDHLDSHKAKIAPRNKTQAANSSTKGIKGYGYSGENFSDFFSRFKIRLKLRLMRVAKSGGYFFHKKFLERFYNQYKPALIELQVFYLEAFKKNLTAASRIIDRLDSIKPLYFELIEMTGNLYSKITVDQIVDHHLNFPGVPKKVSELREPLLEIYRKLYVLKPYENSILNAFETAGQFYRKIYDNKNNTAASLTKKIDSDLFVLFHKLYPRLHLLFCHFNGCLYEETDPEIEKILSISANEKPGNRVLGKNRDFPQQGEEQDADYEVENIEIAAVDSDTSVEFDPLAEGYKYMAEIDISEQKKLFDKKRLFEDMDDNDKIFYTFMYFAAFDREYSALLTTGKVKYRIDFGDRSKTDFKQRLLSLYDEMRGLYESFKDYTESTANYYKLKNERPIGSSGYIDYTKKLDLFHGKRVDAGKMARMKVKAFMERVADSTAELMADISSESGHIDNPGEILQFSSVEGNEKINGRNIYDAFNTVYLYSAALAHRLGPAGDLSGGIEFEPDKKPVQKIFSKPSENDVAGQKPDMVLIKDDKSKKSSNEKKSDSNTAGSLLDELDDFL